MYIYNKSYIHIYICICNIYIYQDSNYTVCSHTYIYNQSWARKVVDVCELYTEIHVYM